MPVKKASIAAATSSGSGPAALARPRKRSSLSLNGSTNGSDAAAGSTPMPVAAPVKKSGTKTRTAIASTPIAAQQAALSAAPAATATHSPTPSTAVAPPSSSATSSVLRTRVVASTHTNPNAPPTSSNSPNSAPQAASATALDLSRKTTTAVKSAAPRARTSAVSTQAAPVANPEADTPALSGAATTVASSAAPLVRRQRGSTSVAAGAGSAAFIAVASSTNASPLPATHANRSSGTAAPSPPPAAFCHHPAPSAPPTPPPAPTLAAPAGCNGGAPPTEHNARSSIATASTRPRRASATAHSDGSAHATKANPNAAPAGPPSPPPTPIPAPSTTAADTPAEEKREEHAHSTIATVLPLRKRASAAIASGTKVRASAKATPTSAVTADTAAAPPSSVERAAKKRTVVRRGSDGGTTAVAAAGAGRTSATLVSRRTSARGSVSVPATAASTAPPTRDSSVAQPPTGNAAAGSAAAAAPVVPTTTSAAEAESLTSTALNTARDSASEFESMALGTTVATPNNTVPSLGSFSRRSHGPVVSEEWTRSIIKPGDEQLLYAPASAAFARTSSGSGFGGARDPAGSAQRASRGRSSPYDPQLRRAQQTVLQQRHMATPTPGRRSTRGATTGASGAPSGGSGSRVGSTVKRSGTRLQQVRHEAEERQRSLNATLSTPNNESDSVKRGQGSTVGHGTVAPTPTSPTPSRMSESSVNTGVGIGERLSAGTPMSRRSTGSNDVPLEHIPGAASVIGGTFRSTPPGVSNQQRSSPSFALFARPTPRIFATPSPRGSTGTGGVPGMMTFGVSNAPYYTGNEELTKLTRVREDMLRALLLSSTSAQAATEVSASATPTAGAGEPPQSQEEISTAVTPTSNSASSLLTMHADPRVGESATSGAASPSAANRPRQRIYGVDIRPGAGGEAVVSPQKAPATDVSKPRGRVSTGTNTAESILVSSIRQKPSGGLAVGSAGAVGGTSAVSPARSPAASGHASSGATTRPKLDTTALGAADAVFSATNSATRMPRRSAVTVALASLQPANTLGERVRAELVRQQENSQKSLPTAAAVPARRESTDTKSTPAATAPLVHPRSAPISFEEATRRLLLDPFFPLVSEENYQRLVLQNDEYNERKALIVRICATPPPKPLSPSQAERGDNGEGGQPRRSTTLGPKAARALEMDLAEADEVAPAALTIDATMTPTTPIPFSFAATSPGGTNNSISSNGGGGNGGAAPRRPSVQYGGPSAYPSPSQSRARSPSPGAPPTSPHVGASPNSPSASSPAREGKLLVNAVMPSEKTGPIKPIAVSGVWYTQAVAPADAAQSSAFQRTLSASNLNNGPDIPVGGNSPHRAYSRSPSASRSSSRHNTRRGSLLHGAQQSTSAAQPASRSDSSDGESTASDNAVDEAEVALRRVLPRWGPFRTSASVAAATTPASSTGRSQQNVSSTNSAGVPRSHHAARKSRKPVDGKSSAAASEASLAGTTSSTASELPSAMLDELDAYVHFFLKRFRNADAATRAEIGDAPETPLALQRAIRQSLRLSCGSITGGSAEDDAEGVSTELQDPLDDGSYHSQNVQYILDLLGSLLQMQDSFCEDVFGGRAALRVARESKPDKAKPTEADFLATVMWHPVPDKGGQFNTGDDVQKAGLGSNVTRTVRKARARPMLKLHDPELHAVELMFANHSGGVPGVAKGNAAPSEKK